MIYHIYIIILCYIIYNYYLSFHLNRYLINQEMGGIVNKVCNDLEYSYTKYNTYYDYKLLLVNL